MDRRELEELYTGVGQPIPTDIGCMARNVALVRLALMAAIGIPLLLGFCCLGLAALFAINGSSPLFKPTPVSTPTVRPLPTRPPRGVAPPDVVVLVELMLGHTRWPSPACQWQAPPARSRGGGAGEGKMKGLATTPRFPHRDGQRRWHRRPAPLVGAVATARSIVAT